MLRGNKIVARDRVAAPMAACNAATMAIVCSRATLLCTSSAVLYVLGCTSRPGPQDTEGDTDPTTVDTADPTAASTTTASTGAPTTTESGAPTTTTSEAPVCGDGIVGDGEACDDGNADPDDGCTVDCTRVGVPLWTHTFNGPPNLVDRASSVAFDPAGRVIVVGTTFVDAEASAGLVIVLDPAGTEVWKKVLPAETGLSAVTVDDAGTIYAAGFTMEPDKTIHIRAFDPAGAELWTFSEPSPPDGSSFGSSFGELAVTDDALFSSGYELTGPDGIELVARRHQKDGGAIVWKSTTNGGAPQADGLGLAVAGANLVVVGHAFGGGDPELHPIVAVFDGAGGLKSAKVEPVNGAWHAVAAIGAGGDVVLAGELADGEGVRQLIVRRLGPDGVEVWSQVDPFDVHGVEASGVAVGAGEEIVVSGYFQSSEHQVDMVTGRLRGDGGPVWAATYDNAEAHLNDATMATAFGPQFIVVAGYEKTLTQDYNGWVRAYTIE